MESINLKVRLLEFINYLGISVSAFEKESKLSNGYIKNFKGDIGALKLEYILSKFPNLNRKWLLYGEGEMLKDVSVQQTSYGDHSPNVNGDGNTIAGDASIDHALSEIAEYRKLLEKTFAMIEKRDAQIEKRDAQIDHLIALLEDKK